MNEPYQSRADDEMQDLDLTHQQAVKYGRDMAEIFKQERAKREALEVAYKKLEGALESMSDGFLVVDEHLHIVEINQACADLFELKLQDALGQPLNTLLIGNDTETFCDTLLSVEREKQICQLELLAPIERTVLIHAAPLPDESWVLVVHDITWEERVNNMREEFLNLAAHELRTPLSGVLGFASLLEQVIDEEQLGEEAWLFLDKILKSAERLRDTVNDLLDFTVSNAQEIKVQVVDLRKIVKETVALLNKQAAERNVTVSLKLASDPMPVFGEERLLSVAIGHLIENGVRYNKPYGSLTIESRLNGDAYDLIFSDTGIGITQKDLEYIFKPFFQVEEHKTRRSVGMGLGLSIVQRTVAMHRGRVAGRSEPNVGSVFTISLPCFSDENLETAKSEWLKIQRDLRNRSKEPSIDEQTQSLINSLKAQLQVTQSQSLAYARDLAKLYKIQRAEAKAMKVKEAKITHTDRLALMGRLAAGVAHDLSNLIGPILGYAQVILRNRDIIDPNLGDIIERILNTSRRANILLRQMVNLSTIHSEAQEKIKLNELIRETLLLLEIKINQANITLTEVYGDNLPEIRGSTVQISQVILNILINAIDVMASGGNLTVRTAVKQTSEKGFVQLQISDTGDGIAPEHLPHIFEAFFTTKQENSGTGLGLSISKDIVENHKGYISVESEPGKGTIFTILLPEMAEDLEQANASET